MGTTTPTAGKHAAEETPEDVLIGKIDLYDGFQVDEEHLPDDVETFNRRLELSLEHWEATGRRGIWLRIPAGKAHLVGHAVQHKFKFHHAEPEYLMLTRWLPNTEDKLPPNASHQVGVGAFVLNERREMLVVREKSGPLRGTGVWKMPTGLVGQGEDVVDAALREVAEETGVRASFDRLLAIRQAHGVAFGKSDLFFVVALRPEAGQGPELVPQEDEIEEARWMPLEEYASSDFVKKRTLLKRMTECCVAFANGEYVGWDASLLEYGQHTQAPATKARVDLFLSGDIRSSSL